MGQTSSSSVQEVNATKKTVCDDDKCSLENKSATTTVKSDDQTKKLKPCCACPETKKARDTCIVERGEENCRDLIEAHKECMRKLGFKV